MSFHRDIRAWAAGVLAALDGAGRVLPYVPVLRTWDQFRAAFDTGERTAQGATVWRGWTIQVTARALEGRDCKAPRLYTLEYTYYRTPDEGDDPAAPGETLFEGRSELDVWDHLAAAADALSPIAKPAIAGLYKLESAVIEPRVDYRAWDQSGTQLSHVARITQTARQQL